LIAHDHAGAKLPSTTLSGFKKSRFKTFSAPVAEEQIFAIVPAANDVANRSRILDTLLSGHQKLF